ncbi:hypothetical protein [Sphingomonas sp.]|uniref:hypothetical protein n=1 Tax=Sphingomonas sp. TaxID=28214 RepID=UPI001EB8B4F7|nr:hypothetical protein [Sphingomonas sp.]MBX3595485.1 hypothetical protein [Sphingomonas sp.]
MQSGSTPPLWFKAVTILLLLWALAGCASLYLHFAFGAEMDPNATDYDRRLYADLPTWFHAVYVAAVAAGLLGAVGLLLRRRWAFALSELSLIAVVIQFGWMFLVTDIVAVKGVWVTYFPAAIFGIQAFQLWLAFHAGRRGWLG